MNKDVKGHFRQWTDEATEGICSDEKEKAIRNVEVYSVDYILSMKKSVLATWRQ